MDKELMNASQKIKRIRGILGIPQVKLSGKGLDRSTISNLERGKIELTHNIARVIANNANVIARRQKIELNITEEWLMEDEIQQAVKLMKSNLNDIEFEHIRKQVKEIIETKDVNKNYLFTLYNICVMRCLRNHNISDAEDYLLKMCDISENYNQKLYTIKIITNIYFRLGQYNNVITWGKNGISIINKLKDKKSMSIKGIYFNMALSYRCLLKNNECINILECLSNYKLESGQKLDIELIKEDIERENGNFDIAHHMLEIILKESEDINDIYRYTLAYIDLAKLYSKENNSKAINCADIVLKQLDSSKNSLKQLNFCDTLYNILCVYVQFKCGGKKIDNVFEKLICISTETKDYCFQIKAINLLHEYYKSINNIVGLKTLISIIEKMELTDSKLTVLHFKILATLYFNKDTNFKNELISGLESVSKIVI